MQDVAPDLVAPAGLDVLALELADLGLLLLEGPLEQPRLQDLDRHLLVLGLAPLVLALGDDPGRQVGQPDRRVGLVDVLAAGALRPERVDPDLVPVELDLDVVVGLRQDLDEGERRLAPLLGVERADPDEAVDAALGAEPAVGARGRRPRRSTLLRPACSPSCWSTISVLKRWRSAQRRYIRRSISAQSVASVPPAPALIVRIAPRSSYSPEKRSAVRSRAKSVSRAAAVAVELGGRARRRRTPRRARGSRGGRRRGVSRPRQSSISERRPSASRRIFWAAALVVPEPGLAGQRLELGDARLLRPEVKDAPRSTGSARPGRGRWTRPPSSGPGGPGAGSDGAR